MRARRTHAPTCCIRARVCAHAIGRPRIRADTCERVPSAWTAGGSVSQAFAYASAFNADIASWNVLRVTIYTSAFGGVGLADCIKRGVYDNWGSTLRTAYPSWSSLSSVCSTPRCEGRSAAMRALGTRRIGA